METKHLVFFSGGVGSWSAAKRVVEQHGTENTILLFADTLIEDEDLYRFIVEAADDVGVPLTTIADGRTPWEVFHDEKFLGNSRIDPCSKILKRQFMDKWRDEHCDVENTVCYVGIDWTEKHRIANICKRVAPWVYEAPMCDRPLVSKEKMLRNLDKAGIARPRLYGMGFPHNNCGGFCIKAGHAQFINLLEKMPERYAEHEAQEEAFREFISRDVSIMKDRRNNEVKPLTMKQMRERHAAGDKQHDLFGWGGCGCAVD